MAFEDFARHFTHLDLVHVGPDDWMNEPALHSKKPWRAVLARRRWRGGYNAGGGAQHTGQSSIHSFIQLLIQLVSKSVMQSLSQEKRIMKKNRERKKNVKLRMKTKNGAAKRK